MELLQNTSMKKGTDLFRISTRVKAKRDKIEDSYEGLIENGLIDDVSLTKKRKKKVTATTTSTGEVKRAPKKSAMELLAQYRR